MSFTEDHFNDTVSHRAGFEELLTTDEAALLLRMHPKTVARKVRENRIRAYKSGKGWKFRKPDLDEYVQSTASRQ